ncbi:hypothetical protein AAEZ63_00755 [Myroides sp. C2723]|uniref:hypothetical protein n=2 Tax=unclassified Myroides TaxID=2642485 RepID=UPI00310114E1
MMKNKYDMRNLAIIVLMSLCVNVFGQSKQVGVGVALPQENLDVEGTMRMRTIKANKENDDVYLLVKDNKGTINKVSKDLYGQNLDFVNKIKIEPNETVQVKNETGYPLTSILILTKNNCGRRMIVTFQSNLGALVFLNGIARDQVAEPEIVAIPANVTAYSAEWIVKFSKITRCKDGKGGYSGIADFFDFSIRKLDEKTYEIKSLASHVKTMSVYFEKI